MSVPFRFMAPMRVRSGSKLPMNRRSRGRESTLTFRSEEVRRLTTAATEFMVAMRVRSRWDLSMSRALAKALLRRASVWSAATPVAAHAKGGLKKAPLRRGASWCIWIARVPS